MNSSINTGFFPKAKDKEGPQNLMAQVNQSSVPSGGTIMVMSQKDKGDIKKITNNLYITNINMSYQEKAQLLETFGASSVSFFGDTIKVYQISGQALDYPSTGPNPQITMHMGALNLLYNNHLRATRLIKDGNIGVIKIFNHLIYGYPMSLKTSYSSSSDKLASFSFNWLVIKHTQNLPGMFSEKDLEDLTSSSNLASTKAGMAALKYINDYLEFVQTNLIIKINSEGEVTENEEQDSKGRRVPVRIDLLDFIASTNSDRRESFKLNLITFTKISPDTDNYETLITKIKDGISSFYGNLSGNDEEEGKPAYKNITDNKELEPYIGNMFESEDSFKEVMNFLKSSATLRSTLITRKMQLIYSG